MKNQQHHQDCPFCKWIIDKPEYAIEENNSFLSLANISPDSEGHVLIIARQPRTNIAELTEEEWNDLLPILQSTTNKITDIFSPQGFNIYSNAGAEGAARQAVFHFHLHVTPERIGNRGVGYLRKPWYIPSPQKYEEIEKDFSSKQGIISENKKSKVIVKLIEREQSSDEAHLIITSRETLKSDLNQVDSATWNQMGELFRETIQKLLNKQDLDVKSLRTCIFLGRIGGLKDNPQFQIHLIPRYVAKGSDSKEIIPVPPEVLEVAEKLRNVKDHYVNVQEWLDRYYPKEKRKDVSELDISGKKLEGDLDLVDFTNLKEININGNPQLREIKNKKISTRVKLTNAQEWLNREFSEEEKSKIEFLDISKKSLEGNLNLEDFINLRKLNCDGNQITKLDLSKNFQLIKLYCSENRLSEIDLKNNKNLTKLCCRNNRLTDLDLSNCKNLQLLEVQNFESYTKVKNSLFGDYSEKYYEKYYNNNFNKLVNITFLEQLPNPDKLKTLWLSGNSIHNDLTIFTRFVNLETLGLETQNYSENFIKEKGNKFYGSLEILKDLTKLKELYLSNTDIDSGLEYLPENVEEIHCSRQKRPESRIRKIEKELKKGNSFVFSDNKYVKKPNIKSQLTYAETLKVQLTSLEKELKNSNDKNDKEKPIIQRKINVCENLIKAWEKPLELPTAEKFNKIKEEVVGFEEFIEEISNYLKVAHKPRVSGKRIIPKQGFYLLLGKPGIGKSYIAGKIAEYLGKRFININCANADLSELVGFPQQYIGSDFGKIVREMAKKQDRTPLVLLDEIDKCKYNHGAKEILNTISILFDDTKNETDFDDKFLKSSVPMNEVFFVATANDEKNLPNFIHSRCTEVNIKVLTWEQRMKIVRREVESQLEESELKQYSEYIVENKELLKKLLVKEWGVRQTKINVRKFIEQLDDLDTQYEGDKEENLGKVNIQSDVGLVNYLTNYPWKELIKSAGLDPHCPASQDEEHMKSCECFIPNQVPSWEENMEEQNLPSQKNELESLLADFSEYLPKYFSKKENELPVGDDGYKQELKEKKIKESNIELKFRLNSVQNKPEAYLYLAHLLYPLFDERKKPDKRYNSELTLYKDASEIIREVWQKKKLKQDWLPKEELKQVLGSHIYESISFVSDFSNHKVDKKIIDHLFDKFFSIIKSRDVEFGNSVLTKIFTDWNTLSLGHIDTPLSNNIRTFSKFLALEPNIKESWKKKLEESIDKLKKHHTELEISEAFINKFRDRIDDYTRYYGFQTAELYILYNHEIREEVPKYIRKVKNEMGSRFINFNQTFKKWNKERIREEDSELKNKDKELNEKLLNNDINSFGDFVLSKFTEQTGSVNESQNKSSRFYFQPEQVWREIENVKEEIQRRTLDIAPSIPLSLQRDDNTPIANRLNELEKECKAYLEKSKSKIIGSWLLDKIKEKVKLLKEVFLEYHKDEIEERIEDIIDSLWNNDEEEKERRKKLTEMLKALLSENVDESFEYNYEKEKLIYKNKEYLPLPKDKRLVSRRELPLKLFSVKKYLEKEEEGEIKLTEENIEERLIRNCIIKDDDKDIKEEINYAALSYVCGDEPAKPKKHMSTKAKKSLARAISACKCLEIDYLWIDKLCIDQENSEEISQEMRKFHQYYSNNIITLVSIGGKLRDDNNSLPSFPEILRKIVNSQWFKRSWTFQEGWLSKHTVFMFDDILVEGKSIAQTWVLSQPVYTKYAKYNSLEEEEKSLKKIATPVGWVHYEKGYDQEDKLELSLGQVLKEVKYRERIHAVDGICSLLGLLPYGDKLDIRGHYKEKNNNYTEKELNAVLLDVMKAAIENGYYGDFFGWHGAGDNWLPKITNIKKGSTSSKGGLIVMCKCKDRDNLHNKHDCKFVKISNKGIEIKGYQWVITGVNNKKIIGIEEKKGFLIEGGLHKVDIEIENGSITLTGAYETLNDIKEGDKLLMIDREEWEMESPFAILVSTKEESSNYYRKGLVGFFSGESDAKKIESLEIKKWLIIKTGLEKIFTSQTQIEIPPK
jgi:diadenosine tetraphosphate (Ap4A) HIT family hydrolase/ATP-dependent Lon protease